MSPSACPSRASATRSADGRKAEPRPETIVTTARKATTLRMRRGPRDRGVCMWTSLVRHHSVAEAAGRDGPDLALADRPVMDLPGRSAHPRPAVLAMRPHRRPRDRSNPSPLQAPEPRCRTSLGAGGGICSRGRPGIPSRASDLVTMNVRAARSDSSLARVAVPSCPRIGPLAFLDQVLHNAPTTEEGTTLIQRGGGIGPLKPQQPPGFPGRC